jgi:hypothetical protein
MQARNQTKNDGNNRHVLTGPTCRHYPSVRPATLVRLHDLVYSAKTRYLLAHAARDCPRHSSLSKAILNSTLNGVVNALNLICSEGVINQLPERDPNRTTLVIGLLHQQVEHVELGIDANIGAA